MGKVKTTEKRRWQRAVNVVKLPGGTDGGGRVAGLLSPSYVMMMPFKRQALVEFSAVESADRCVSCGTKEPVYIAGWILFTLISLLHLSSNARHYSGDVTLCLAAHKARISELYIWAKPALHMEMNLFAFEFAIGEQLCNCVCIFTVYSSL